MILDSLFADGSTDTMEDPGVYTTILVAGTFGGGTATLEVSADGTNWYPTDPAASWTSSGLKAVTLGKGILFRVTLAGATAPSLNVYAFFGRGS